MPRPRALAAGGAVLAQVWGLGLGLTSAYAASGEPGAGPVGRSDTPALLDQLSSTAVPLVEHPAAPVGQVLQERIRSGGLPLPGQATTVPDAFAIAAVLLPSVPPQPRGDDAQRASRSLPVGGDTRRPGGQAATGPQPAGGSAAMAGATTPNRSRADAEPAVDSPGAAVPAQFPGGQGPEQQDLGLTAAAPVSGGDEYTAVLVPIAAGLLLTGAAMYKHRGLPRGH
ncbi:hypothetical protein ABT095_05950 [Kitasatospora sp. NPDC002227]|uniref:hypothetical protein n=1 Tax=Kitasatospora sp. NPDC002227 TaxID=3154773 RepID=UPI003320FC74